MTRSETPPELCGWQKLDAGVGEGGRHVFHRLRQRDPGLQAGHGHRAAAHLLRRALGMDDAATSGHQVHIARRNHHFRAERIAVADFAVEQVGHRRKADMRMRAHVEHLAGAQDGRAHLVEEDERANHAALRRRQRAAHFEAAYVLGGGEDHGFDQVRGGAVAGGWVYAGEEAHGNQCLSRKSQKLIHLWKIGARRPHP